MFAAQILLFDSLIRHYYSSYFYEAPIAQSLQKTSSVLDLSSLKKDFRIWQWAIQTLADNSQLESLCCQKLPKNQATTEFIKLLATALSKNTHLKTLVLRHNPIGNTEVAFIAEMLKSNLTLKGIDLSYTEIDPLGIDKIVLALKENKGLKILKLAGSDLGRSTNYFFQTLSTHESLQELDLSNSYLQFDSGLSQLLNESESLKKLNLSMNSFGTYDLDYLTDGLRKNKNLVHLNLASCALDASTAGRLKNLAEVLSIHPSLTYLDLSSNGLDPEKYPLATEIIKNSSSIQSLNLTANNIGDEGLRNLATGIQSNNSLTTLVLQRNHVSNEGLKHLSEALQQNNTLVHLDLLENDFNSVQDLCDHLQNNISITSIDFDRGRISDNSLIELEKLLKRNQRIKSSYLILLNEAQAKNDLHAMLRVLKEMKHEFHKKDENVWDPAQLETIYNSSIELIKSKLKEELTKDTNPEQNLLYFIDIYIKATPLLNELKPELLSAVLHYKNTASLQENEMELFNKLGDFLEQNREEYESINAESMESFKNVLDFLAQKIVSTYDAKEMESNPTPPSAASVKKYYNQDDFIAKLREDSNYRALNRARLRFSGLCELICNYIIKEDLMGLSSQSESLDGSDFNRILPSNLNDIHLLAGVYQLNTDWVLGSHILDTSSHFEKLKAYLLNIYPYSLFSSADVSNDGKQLAPHLFTKKLDKLEPGTYIKFMAFSKSFGKMEGHSMLIKKNHNNTYSFFDPNKGEQLELSSLELCTKLNKSLKLYDATHMAFLDGLKYIKSLSQPASNERNASLSRMHLSVMKIDPLDRRANINAVYNLLSDSLFRNEDNTSPRYINELRNILSQIDYNNESNIVKSIIEIKKISKMEPSPDENTQVHSLRAVFNSPTSTTFASIRANLYKDPQIHKIMEDPDSHEPITAHSGS
ncbi:hypothetical protein [Legionella bozemanae]|uniref:Ankyrin repeat protein n=1 Tax=Legionella bozemanae TaxID=447 RepID=A0A0W0RBZ0_LEGBO|nr:hypothetical protein [Legionella bozemanae]KTC68575.1 ankyrin repeat protein [Legionella bozemanae]STO33061.1 Ran GTPase-activating protein (RanGAP) involved in mRNA processing and transport [Legionella bozemanae]